MVYRGVPSQGCHSCRRRRLKCDQKRPGCTQCSRISIKCPGYRDKLDIWFHDETVAVTQKVHKEQNPTKQDAVDENGDSNVNSRAVSYPNAQLLWYTHTPKLIVEDCASTYFHRQYLPGSHFAYLTDLIRVARPGSALSQAVLASALADFSNEHQDANTMYTARKTYSQALRLTNEALSSPVEATRDETLAAILILGLYEAFALTDRQVSSENWNEHVKGSAALLRLRGFKQLETEMGVLLFAHVCANIEIIAVQHRLPLPLDVMEHLNHEAMRLYSGTYISWLLQHLQLAASFATIRYECTQDPNIDPKELVPKLMGLDRKLMANVSQIPARPQNVQDFTLSAEPLLPPLSHPDPRVAQVWNSLRMMRLFLNGTTHCLLLNDDTATHYRLTDGTNIEVISHQELLASTLRTSQQMTDEICAGLSVLQQKPSEKRRVTLTEASWLLYPLSVAGDSPFLSDEARQYAVDQLQSLGKDNGMSQALWMADMLKKRSGDEGWAHMYHIQ